MSQMSQEDFNKRIFTHTKVLEHQLENSKLYTQREMSEREIVIESCLGQLERYGIDKWKKDFIRIVTRCDESYADNSKISLDMAENVRNKFLENLLSKISPSLKRFQEVFVEPQEFIMRRQAPSFFQRNDILACYVSPSLIPDKLMEDLKLCDFSDCKGNPLLRLKRKADPATIEALKLIFMNLSPIAPHNHRIYQLCYVKSDKPDVQKILEQYNQGCVGKFLVISNLGTSKKIFTIDDIKNSGISFQRRKVSFFSDAETLSRVSAHIEESYEGELEKLSKLSHEISLIRAKLFSWRKDTPDSTKRIIINDTCKMCDEVTEELSKIINEHKLDAVKLIDELYQAQKKRNNPWGYALKLSAVISRLEDRIIETSYINSKKNIDGIFVKRLYTSARYKVDTILEELSKINKHIRSRSFMANDGDLFSLKIAILELGKVKHEPYSTMGKKILENFFKFEQIFTANVNKKQLLSLIRKMQFICFLEEKVDRELKKALLPELSDDIREQHLSNAISNLKEHKGYFSSQNIEEYSKTLNDTIKLLEEIKESFQELGRDKKALKAFNLQAIILELTEKQYPLFNDIDTDFI